MLLREAFILEPYCIKDQVKPLTGELIVYSSNEERLWNLYIRNVFSVKGSPGKSFYSCHAHIFCLGVIWNPMEGNCL